MLVCMKTLIQSLIHQITSRWRERWHLSLELIALRHQVEVLKRSGKRPQFSSSDRCFWLLLSSWWSKWPQAPEIMQADTVRRWRRQGVWHHLSWRRERKRPGRPPIPAETRKLIREMSRDNRLWGAPRIHGELAKLGIKISRTTVAKYMDRRSGPPSPTWRTFWRTHTPDFHVHEVYAELSGRLHAVSTKVLRIIPTLCDWLWGLVSGWRRWSVYRHVRPAPPSIASDMASMVRPLRVVEWVQAFGRSPPDYESSSIDPPAHLDPPIEMGRAAVRRVSSVRSGRGVHPQATFTPQTVHNVQRPDGSQQAAA
jgi:hypothetical protein